MTTTYGKAVAENMAHMGSNLAEWTAVEISGLADTTNDKGEALKMPQFVFPVGYDSAPSMFKNQNAACGINCELCGHDIKNVYWIKNDSRKWTMAVGSECITGFTADGKTGVEMSEDVRRAQNRELVIALVTLAKAIHYSFGFMASMGYGRHQHAWVIGDARTLHKSILKLLGKIDADSTDGAISGFITRKGSEAKALLQTVTAWQKETAILQAAIRNLKTKASRQQNIVTLRRENGQPAAEWQIASAQRSLDAYNADIARIETNGSLV